MQRHSLGLIALGLLIGGAVFALGWSVPQGAHSASGSMIKIGLVLGAVWLALPQIDRFLARTPRWLIAVSLVGLILVVIRPITAVVMVPAVIALWIFGPRLASKADAMIFGGNRKPSRRRRD